MVVRIVRVARVAIAGFDCIDATLVIVVIAVRVGLADRVVHVVVCGIFASIDLARVVANVVNAVGGAIMIVAVLVVAAIAVSLCLWSLCYCGECCHCPCWCCSYAC